MLATVIVKPEKVCAASGVYFAACYFCLSESFLVKASEPFINLCPDSLVGVKKSVSSILWLVTWGRGGDIHRETIEVNANENLSQKNKSLLKYYFGQCLLSGVYFTYTTFRKSSRGSPII